MDTSSSLVAYRLQVVNFLQSLSIKYTPISDVYNAMLTAAGYEVTSDPVTWKYYLNLAGEYHAADTVMTIMSLDTQEQVPFTKATLIAHPLTAAAYRPGQPEYAELCARYPEQVDLIKSIVYPVTDIRAAIAAEELTVLAYGAGILETPEQPIVVQEIQEFLNHVGLRWNMDFLRYEAYYHLTFMGLLWQSLVACVLKTRIKNLHTSAVHSFHIWEYLASNGLGDYRNDLTRRATLFLYRNIKYIIANRGKASTLTLLVNRLLTEQSIGLVGKTIRQQTADSVQTCEWVPELISEAVPTEFAGMVRSRPNEDIATMTYRLYDIGAEVDISGAHVAELSRQLGSTPLNSLPTKLLEIAPVTLDRKYADVLVTFLLDSLVAAVSAGRYQPVIDLSDAVTGVQLRMGPRDALLLYYYAIKRMFGETPVNLPDKYQPKFTYRFDAATVVKPTTITHNGFTIPLHNLLDVDAFVAGTEFPAGVKTAGVEYMAALTTQFLALVRQISDSRAATDRLVSRAIATVFDSVTTKTPYALSLSEHRTYVEWFSDSSQNNYASILSAYEGSSNAAALWSSLADAVMTALLPLNETLLNYSNEESTAALYGRLKQLFVQLCSYNVIFLDTPRDVQHWVFATKIDYDLVGRTSRERLAHDPTLDLLVIPQGSEGLISAPTGDWPVTVVEDAQSTGSWLHRRTVTPSSVVREAMPVDNATTPDILPASAQITIPVPSGIKMGVSFTYTP